VLRLRIRELIDWTDSRGMARSRLDPFHAVLVGSARLEGCHFRPWKIGFVDDSLPAAPDAKPLLATASAGELTVAHALPVGLAGQLARANVDVWLTFLSALGLGARPTVAILKDEIWDEHHREWLGLSNAVAKGVVRFHTELETLDDRTALAKLDRERAALVLSVWWPSSAGYLAVAFGAPACSPDRVSNLLRTKINSCEDMESIEAVAVTSQSFHGAGFAVLSSPTKWPVHRRALESMGWRDGAVVNGTGSGDPER
jgi:hypothetical protein